MSDREIWLRAKKRKSPDERDRVAIEFEDRCTVFEAWDQKLLPHELFHYAVEAVLPLRGFVRATAEGTDADELVRTRDPQALRAENLTNAFQYELAGVATEDGLRETLASFGEESDPTSDEELEAIRALLHHLVERWGALGPGEKLEVRLLALDR